MSLVEISRSGEIAIERRASFAEARVIGSGSFRKELCKIVSLRRVEIYDYDESAPLVGPVHTGWNEIKLYDDFEIQNGIYTGLKIWWTSSYKCYVPQISVLIIGETED